MVEWGLVAVAAPGYVVTTYAALALVGKAPMRFKRWDRERIEDEHAKIVQAEQLAEIAPLAETLTTLARKADLILAAIQPNGGASMRDALTRIESKLDTHLEASDHTEASVVARLDALERNRA